MGVAHSRLLRMRLSEVDQLSSEEERVKARNQALAEFEDIISTIAEFVSESPSSRRIWGCIVVDRGGVDLLAYVRKVHSPSFNLCDCTSHPPYLASMRCASLRFLFTTSEYSAVSPPMELSMISSIRNSGGRGIFIVRHAVL